MPVHRPARSGGGCNMRDLDMNLPAGEMEELPVGALEEDEEYYAAATPRPKKLRLSQQQSRLLEESFRHNHTLNPRQREALALELNLTSRQVEVWFQNRRARSKLKQTEMECQYLRRCFGSLTEENRRLQRELQALRAAPPAPLSPNHNCEPAPAAALSMCPRCERVTTAGGGAAAPPAAAEAVLQGGSCPFARGINAFSWPSAAC
ncbi:hypothetical protein Taro_016794 [Colocasia esculenta]|uniref:Homeobox domain-containing protein n=1 Tax=Colocasia esculenta TaxID=4460 RepID=A0A843ULC3_COLES|nr:hypothetical protein [Colocasia esculenta]